jgi:putative alpha-1,2-mannosidase
LIGDVYQSGALFSYAGHPKQVNIRVGVSFLSAEQACANAESEIGSSSFNDIVAKAKALWQEKLSKIEIDIANTPANITEMLYSSLYRASLTPVGCFSCENVGSCCSQGYRTMLPASRREYS